MKQMQIQDLILSYPEGFHEMSREEKAGLAFYNGESGVCLSDPEAHILVTIGCKESRLAFLLQARDAAKKAEEHIRKPMQAYQYRLEEFSDHRVGGEKACGYRYRYTVQDIPMTGETVVVKHKKAFYYLNFYARTESLTDSIKKWQAMLDAAAFCG
ncbi:MAG: hypothetical protein K6B40_02890 [Firmicutes bacterium]|nr:hypothetical protein [Bacillota bacterium]